MEKEKPNTQFLINTSEQNPVAVRNALKAAFGDKLVTNSVEATALAPIEAGKASEKAAAKAAEAAVKPKGAGRETASGIADGKTKGTAGGESERSAGGETASEAGAKAGKQAGAEAAAQTGGEAFAQRPAARLDARHGRADGAVRWPTRSRRRSRRLRPPQKRPVRRRSGRSQRPRRRWSNAFAGGSRCTLKFAFEVNHKTAEEMVRAALEANGIDAEQTPPDLSNPDYVEGSDMPSFTWTLRIKLPPAKAAKVLETLQRQVREAPYFPGASAIGSTVAQGTQLQAIYALVASWTLIIIYLWVRFQGVAFGLAAVIALIHDVLVMLGGIAFSYYIAPYFGFLMIDPFKINLAIVAAFLTIIGYSVNDTIVVFDRIREVRGKDPRMTRADGQRQHEPDAQPHVADVVHGDVGGGDPLHRRRQGDPRIRLRA